VTQPLARALPLESYSKFRRLAITHAAMVGGDAVMVVALANTLFFDIDPSEARWRVLLFLCLSFAPFLLLAPLIGPVLDRIAGGRRAAIQFVAASRVVLAVLMAVAIDTLALFPLVFVALVLQKTYLVSKSAIVPSVVRSERDLVEANSKLGLIAGIIGAAAVVPAGILQLLGDAKGPATMIYSGVLFAFALYASFSLSADVVAKNAPDAEEELELHSPRVSMGAIAMMLMRASIGFVFFVAAFWLQPMEDGTLWLGACVVGAALGAMSGNAIGPRLRLRLSERAMLYGSLGTAGAVGLAAGLIGGVASIVALSYVMSLCGSTGRLGFESMVQRDAPSANRGRALANFETRFQLCWAAAGVVAVAITPSGRIGALVVGIACCGGLAFILLRPRVEGAPATVRRTGARWRVIRR
jgi:hypothetical protein